MTVKVRDEGQYAKRSATIRSTEAAPKSSAAHGKGAGQPKAGASGRRTGSRG